MYLKGRYLLLLLLALAACTPCHTDPVETRLIASPTAIASSELISIDSLMWQQPDSALMRLLPFFDTDCKGARFCVSTATEYNRHYAHLLLAELLYKNDCAQTNRPELQQAVSYFDSLVRQAFPPFKGVPEGRGIHTNNSNDILSFLDARAHYINGVGYYENDSAVEACAEYLKALEIIEEHFGEKELVGKRAHFMALTYTRLTGLFSDQYLHEQAVYFGKCAMGYYNRYDATIGHLVWMFDEIGSNYDVMGNLDSAIVYYNKGIEMLTDTNNLAYRDLSVHIAFLTYQLTKEPSIVVKQLRSQLVLSESRKEYLSRSLTIGEIFFHERQFDSAYVYLSDVFYYSDNIDSKKQAAEWLVEICKELYRISEMHEYASFLVPFATQVENKSSIKSQLAELYNNYRQHETEQQHRRRLMKQIMCSVTVVIVLLVVLLGVFVLYQKNKWKKQKLEAQIQEEQYAHEIRQAALSGRLKRSNEALRIQKKESSDLAKEVETHRKRKEWNSLEDFMNEDICQEIKVALQGKQIKREAKSGDYPELHLSDAQLQNLSIAVEKHFCGFEKTLTDLYPKINRNAMNQCLLYLLNIEDVQIASLLSCDYSTVKRRSSKLKEAFNTEKELRQYIRELVL